MKPLKIFSTIDESNSIITSQNQIDNHLTLIQSDELRDKLTELNEKIKENLLGNEENMQVNCLFASNYSHILFKEILNSILRDPEFLNNFNSSLSDVAVSICLILKNDFTNNLLPAQFYTTPTNTNTNFKSSKLNLNSTDNEAMHQNPCTGIQCINTFMPNSYTLNLVNESLSQRIIFVLFKELSLTQNQSAEREIYVQLLHEIYLKQNRIGYYFLFYIYAMSLKLSSDRAMFNSHSHSSYGSPEILSLMRIYFEFTKERQNEIKNDMMSKQQQQQQQRCGQSSSSDELDASDKESNSSSNSDNEYDNSDDVNCSNESNHSDSDQEASESRMGNVDLTEADLILGECFMQDIRLCQQDDPHLFCFLLPFICGPYMLPSYMCNNSELVYLVCSCIDSRQLKDLIASITSHDLIFLKKQNNDKPSVKKNKISTNKKVSKTRLYI